MNFKCFPLTPFTPPSLLLLLLIILHCPPPHLLSLFRPSSALCESISRWAQTPAPHFLPCSLKSHRSGTHSYIYCALCIFCNMWANALIHINIHTTLRDKQLLCICALVLSGHVTQRRKHMCHCLTNIYSAVCSHNSFKSICGQGVFCASSLSCIYMRLLFQMLVHILLELNSS